MILQVTNYCLKMANTYRLLGYLLGEAYPLVEDIPLLNYNMTNKHDLYKNVNTELIGHLKELSPIHQGVLYKF